MAACAGIVSMCHASCHSIVCRPCTPEERGHSQCLESTAILWSTVIVQLQTLLVLPCTSASMVCPRAPHIWCSCLLFDSGSWQISTAANAGSCWVTLCQGLISTARGWLGGLSPFKGAVMPQQAEACSASSALVG